MYIEYVFDNENCVMEISATVCTELKVSDGTQDILFVSVNGSCRGWRVDLLMEKLNGKVEETLLVCKLCGGLLREASLFEFDGGQELRCSMCIPENTTKQPAQLTMNREAVNNKIIICPHQGRGCKWTGRLCNAEQHLEECTYMLVLCPLECVYLKGEKKGEMVKMERRYLAKHQKDSCPMRELKCDFCGDKTVKAKEMNSHLENCEYFPIPCPNDCGFDPEGSGQVTRKCVITHLANECPLQQIECPYLEYGCVERMERRHMDQHEIVFTHKHFKLTINGMKKIIEKQAQRIEKLETAITTLVPTWKFVWKITGINEKIRNKESSFSDPFNVGLYKCQVQINWQTDKGHLGCYICVLKGDFDDKLLWPFKYRYKIVLFNVNINGNNRIWSENITKSHLEKYSSSFKKPTQLRNKGFGIASFITQSLILKDVYCRDDCISLGIEVEWLTW